MPRNSFFMYPLNNENDSDNEDEVFRHWTFDIFDNMFNMFNMFMNFLGWTWSKLKQLWPVLSWIYSVCGYYIMWILLHYAAIHLYPEFCAPYTILGFLLSPFMVSAPHCIAMRWVISEGSSIITAMWVAVAGVLVNKILRKA
jgi:hypothetical protein